MKKAFQIFKRDVRRLLSNPVALVITLGICVIPSLYAWYNIVANWDPYGNTGNVRVAVANNDAGTSNQYVGKLNAGEQTVRELKKNKDLGWVFTNEDAAREGVESGAYYAAIVIPEDFSKNLTSMLTGDFTQPKLKYYVNEKKNAIAPKVTDTGAQTVEEQINQTFVTTVSKTVVQKMQGVAAQADGHAASAEQGLLAGVEGANEAIGDVRKALTGMNDTIDATKTAVAKTDKTLKDLSGQLPSLAEALDEGDTLLKSARGSARTFTTSLSAALSDGLVQISSASSKANTAVGKVAGGIEGAGAKVDGALEDVQSIIDENQKVIDALDGIAGDNEAIAGVIEKLSARNEALQDTHDALSQQSGDIQSTTQAVAGAVAKLDDATQGGSKAIGTAQEGFARDVSPKLGEGLDAFSRVSGNLSGAATSLRSRISGARSLLSQMDDVLDQAKETVSQGDAALKGVRDALQDAAADIAALRGSASLEKLGQLMGADADKTADFMSAPVELETKAVYPVATYGSGVAPFYTNLALWVGGFVLIAIIKLEVDTDGLGKITPSQAYVGRWLLLLGLGLVQALIVCAGDLALGMQCEQPALFMLAGAWISLVYVSVIYALAIAFKHIGKALAVVLVIMQIPGSSGMYPIEMMPAFYRWLHPLLPFTYGINAMRETVAGMYGASYWVNLAALGAFLLVSLLIGMVLRPRLLNLNALFDRQLAQTDLMICEQNDMPREHVSLRAAMRALLDGRAYRRQLLVRVEAFERRYPRIVKAGFAGIALLTVLMFACPAVLGLQIDGKTTLLALWVLGVVAIDAGLIVVEYMHESFATQLRMSALSDEGLRRELRARMAETPLVAKLAGFEGPDGQTDRKAKGSGGAHFRKDGDER